MVNRLLLPSKAPYKLVQLLPDPNLVTKINMPRNDFY